MSESDTSSLYDVELDDDPTSCDLSISQTASLTSCTAENGLLSYPGVKGKKSPLTAAAAGGHPVRYSFAQAFGEKGADAIAVMPIQEADLISAVRFSDSSEMIATGDKGGRIVILRQMQDRASDDGESTLVSSDMDDDVDADDSVCDDRTTQSQRRVTGFEEATAPDNTSSSPLPRQRAPNFTFWTQFQSHEPEFDYLKSMEIEEKINQIRWCRRVNGDHRLITTNDKTIKIWRVFEKQVTAITTLASPYPRISSPVSPSSSCGAMPSACGNSLSALTSAQSAPKQNPCASLSLPVVERRGSFVQAVPRRVFPGVHAYHINSISLNSDEETFLSADDLRVNMWNLNVGGDGFNVLDLKPDNMEELTEVITSAEFHPQHCHLFMHSSSRGTVKLCDLRQSALCQSWSKEYVAHDDKSSRNPFFSEIIASISDVEFSPDGRYVLSRDYMSLRLWDLNMERAPVLVIPVQEHLRNRLCELYENDCIFDKFQCKFSHDGGSLLTGSYNSLFQTYSAADGGGAAVEASVDYVSGMSGRHRFTPEGLSANLIACSPASELVDPSRRILHLDSSPHSEVAAVAAGPALYLYYGDSSTSRII